MDSATGVVGRVLGVEGVLDGSNDVVSWLSCAADSAGGGMDWFDDWLIIG